MCKSVNGILQTWPLLEELNDSLKVNCLKNGVAYWDVFNSMGGAGSMSQWVKHSPPLAGPDYIHFTHRGAVQVGRMLSKSFLICYDFYKFRKQYPLTVKNRLKELRMAPIEPAAKDSIIRKAPTEGRAPSSKDSLITSI